MADDAGFGYHLLFAGPALSGMGFHQAFRSGLFGNVHFFPAMGAVCANAAGSFGISVGAALLGGLFVGIGVGLVVRQGGSSGGDDALALVFPS